MNAAAVAFDSFAFRHDFSGHVSFGILVILSFHIDVGMEEIDRTYRIGVGIDCDPVDILQVRQHFSPQRLAKDRPARPLVHEPVSGQRDDQHVSQFARCFEMTNMADMEEVECPVRLDDCFSRPAEPVYDRRQFLDSSDLVTWRFRFCPTRPRQRNDVGVHLLRSPLWSLR